MSDPNGPEAESEKARVEGGPTAPEGPERALLEETFAAQQLVAQSHLCRDCKHAKRPLGAGWREALCHRPGLPLNLVDGTKVFPCLIARGYPQLCGFMGIHWEHK